MSAGGAPAYERCAIIGIGLIGASFALAGKQAGTLGSVTGVARSAQTRGDALAVGAADEVTDDPVEACAEADLIYLATPVGAIPPLLARIAGSLKAGSTVTDAGSTKAQIVRAARETLPAHVSFIGGHPLAGSEQSGPSAARADLFDGQPYFLTPEPETDRAKLEALRAALESIGARVALVDPERHDAMLAATSHLPHLVAAALAEAVAQSVGGDAAAGLFVGKGFADTTRIAHGPVEVWRDILLHNSGNIAESLERLTTSLAQWTCALREGDGPALAELLERGRQAREALLGP